VSDAEIKRRVEAAQRALAEHSRALQADWEKGKMFPSTRLGDRGPLSPLGGIARPAEAPTQKAKPKSKPGMKW
jgi:hypothetical protein